MTDHVGVNYESIIHIIFLRWQIFRERKKEQVVWTSTRLWKRRRKRKTLGHKKRTRLRTSEAPERIRQPGGSTENDDRPLFPPSGLNYYHPAEHCLLWRRIILLSLGRPGSNALGGDLREGDEDRREVRTGNRVREERPMQRPRFHDLSILRKKTTGPPRKTSDNLSKRIDIVG